MSQGTETWQALELEYQRLAGSDREEDVVRCRQITRQLEKLTTDFLEEHDEPRVRRGPRSARHAGG
jgi:hypothetical protein